MSFTRVTQSMLTSRTLNDLNMNVRELLDIQERLSSGRRVNAPSDDPIVARRTVNIQTVIQRSEQYAENIAMAAPQHQETASILMQVNNRLHRLRELTLQGASDTVADSQLPLIAEEVNEVLEGLLVNGNHVSNDRYIFAGTRTSQAAFEATRDPVTNEITGVAYAGNTEQIRLAISETSTIQINEPGDRAFLGTQDMFQLAIDIRDALRTGDQDFLRDDAIEDIDEAQKQVLTAMARVGAAQNRIESAQDDIEDYIFSNQELLSLTVDADFAETVVNLNQQQNAYQASLNAAARVLQPSLLDFVR